MEYKKEKRTKNLSLRDIHVGDWVQVWSDTTERYSPPLKIIQICDDGTIYLVTSDEERPTPWEENIKNVDALPVTEELLLGFGFDIEQKGYKTGVYYVLYNTKRICEFCEYGFFSAIETSWGIYMYFHEFIDNMRRLFPELLILQWKGIEKNKLEEMSKIMYCGECENFAYEDADGYGICTKNNAECRCSDECHIIHGKT